MENVADDLHLDSVSFRAIANLAYQESGLLLVEEKKTMIQSRLRHRLRDLGIHAFSEYCEFIYSDEGFQERQHLISALTTNVSHFFRENHHYQTLRYVFRDRLPALRAGGKFRIWSAGCSNGQEAVSAAITILEEYPNADMMDVRILGTDIDRQVVRFARTAQYSERFMSSVSSELRSRHFVELEKKLGSKTYMPCEKISKMIQFNELNLLHKWPMIGKFDVIFCRNVVIYFDSKTQRNLWPNFKQILSSEGILFLGHSERISEPEQFCFKIFGPTTYRPA
jgi:chemotaxis protein methyltransferase CheR